MHTEETVAIQNIEFVNTHNQNLLNIGFIVIIFYIITVIICSIIITIIICCIIIIIIIILTFR